MRKGPTDAGESARDENLLSDLPYIMLHLEEISRRADWVETARNATLHRALEFHLARNDEYRAYARSFGLDPAAPGEWAIEDIPLLPSSLFKRPGLKLGSVPSAEIVKHCTSSGTGGSISVVPRDEDTLTHFLGSLSSAQSSLFGLDRIGNHKAFVLGPAPEAAGDLWFSYVLSTMALSYSTEYFERDGRFSARNAAASIGEAARRGAAAMIVGPPLYIAELCQVVETDRRVLPLPENSFVVSAGGWKRAARESIPRPAFSALVERVFALEKQCVRDSFNMVELNTVLSECEYREKHLPPWVEVYARDPVTNTVLKDGEGGILAFYDGSAYSYPCFILSEDYGVTSSGRCACGRYGKRVKILRRMGGIEARGCALKMAGASDARNNNRDRFFKSYFRCPARYRARRREGD